MSVIKNNERQGRRLGKIKKIFKNRLFIFVATALFFSMVGVSAATYFPSYDVTYDNTESGLESTDVQGAIDELYNVCFPPTPAGEQLLDKVNVVTSGDGLYKDNYENGRYIYKGKSPNNYITFNDEVAGWRILSVENDGTLKIMYDNYAGSMVWDTSGSNNWERPATINTYLNETYFNTLSDTAQSQVVSHDFNIGMITSFNNDLSTIISNENSEKWNGKVGLITVSEYLKSNTNTSRCSTIELNNDNNTCYNTTWMHTISNYWTITSDNLSGYVYKKNINYDIVGFKVDYNGSIMDANYAKPVLYLSSDIKITGGDGSQSNPFTIE